jgi:phage gpG-like protein
LVTARLTVTGNKAVLRRLHRLSQRTSLKNVAPAMHRQFKKDEALAFGTKGLSTYDGAWKRLAESTLAAKRQRRQPLDILIATGRLKRSLTARSSDSVYDVSADRLEFGSRVPYAKYHHSLRPRKMRNGKPILPRRRPISLTEKQKDQYRLIFRRYVLTGRRA